MYEKVSPNLNFVDREKQTVEFWKENDIFKKSMENRKEGETYTFYDGPPTANGKPHIGHVLTRVIKDMIPRYQTMKGKYVPRKAGWDTHGLPVELEVEKLLGLNGKEQIEEYGMEPFIKKCKESVWKYIVCPQPAYIFRQYILLSREPHDSPHRRDHRNSPCRHFRKADRRYHQPGCYRAYTRRTRTVAADPHRRNGKKHIIHNVVRQF